jgi:hypothetical protein
MDLLMTWVNLDIERPEIATWVLGLCSKGSYWLCFRANGGWYITTKTGQIFVWNKDRDKQIEIKYWLPIPELPKELFDKLFPPHEREEARRKKERFRSTEIEKERQERTD